MKQKTLLSTADVAQIEKHGLTVKQIGEQLNCFIHGFPALKLVAPATVGNGIVQLSVKQVSLLSSQYDVMAPEFKITKFVPASGAATRMFKDLFSAMNTLESGTGKLPDGVVSFFGSIRRFAFFEDLKNKLSEKKLNIDSLLRAKNYLPILKALLDSDGLDYGRKPKALIKFHLYEKHAKTALEEQIAEGLEHAVGLGNRLNIHFTISPEHEKEFKKLVKCTLDEYKGNTKISVTHSFQQKETDTIAVDINNEPARTKDGKLVFRPGGHGALLQNLNALKTDLIFLKNIDNIVPDRYCGDTITYKKALAAYLLQIVEQVHAFLVMLDDGNVDENDLNDMIRYASEHLFIDVPMWLTSADRLDKMDYLFTCFNRPVRVCGMVKNVGEPGGGPFIVQGANGYSMQIVESSQVNMTDKKQKEIFSQSTHFNPVDLVCFVRDFRGEPFDLTEFSDPDTGFITHKSLEGKEIKAMELPGLWNGAMADWITVFVEVPLSTFNPVKEVNDLLREMHL